MLQGNMVSDDSGAKTGVPRRGKRRSTHSSHEDTRKDECPEQDYSRSDEDGTNCHRSGGKRSKLHRTSGTHSEHADTQQPSSNKTPAESRGSSKRRLPLQQHIDVQPVLDQGGIQVNQDEVVIVLSHEGSSAWDTEESDTQSDTSTPDYKRGRHDKENKALEQRAVMELLQQNQQLNKQREKKKEKKDEDNKLTWQVASEILYSGHDAGVPPTWIRKRPLSTVILCDAYLQKAPRHDARVVMECHPDHDFWRWNIDIRVRRVDVAGFFNVVFCLNKLKNIDGAAPLKNSIQALCRSVRSVNGDCRIFVANLLPMTNTAVLARRILSLNEDIRVAVQSTTRALKKVHLMSVYEHYGQ